MEVSIIRIGNSKGLRLSKTILDKYQINDKIEKSIKRVYTTPGGKFSIAGGDKDVLLFELELRKGTNHKKVLFHSHLSRIIDVVK